MVPGSNTVSDEHNRSEDHNRTETTEPSAPAPETSATGENAAKTVRRTRKATVKKVAPATATPADAHPSEAEAGAGEAAAAPVRKRTPRKRVAAPRVAARAAAPSVATVPDPSAEAADASPDAAAAEGVIDPMPENLGDAHEADDAREAIDLDADPEVIDLSAVFDILDAAGVGVGQSQTSDVSADPDRDEVDAEPAESDPDAVSEDGSDDGTEGATEEPTLPPVLPAFGLLFQAPDPTKARARRATAPQAAPVVTAPSRHLDTDDAESGETDPVDGPEDDDSTDSQRRSRRRRGGKGRRVRVPGETDESEETTADDGADDLQAPDPADDEADSDTEAATRRRRRRRRAGAGAGETATDDGPGVVTRVRESRRRDEVVGVRGSTRLEAKKQRRREGREAGRRRTVITEAEFLARRESVERVMVVRTKDERTQIGVLEDGVLVEHYIDRATNVSMAGNIYLGRVQNVLPSMEAAFVDIGKGRNAVLYAGEVNWDRAGLDSGESRRIENALVPGQTVLVQVTKDPIGHKGARLTSQISLPGRYLVFVPDSSMTGISRKLPDTERARLKRILRDVVPSTAGVIVRTAAEGASEAELRADVERLTRTWEEISARIDELSTAGAGKSKGRKKNGRPATGGSGASTGQGGAPLLLHGEPDMTVRVIRDIFNEDFTSVVVAGDAWTEVSSYVASVAPDLADRVVRWTEPRDLFTHYRVDEQLAKALDRKVWLPSGGSLVIDRTEAMTVIDVNTGKFVGSGGNLEETVTKNNIEAAEEIVRQLRLRDIGGIIVVDFIDMVLESNRDLVIRRLLECLGRDRTKHQVAEVTSLGLVQMTRKRVGSGLIEVFSEPCEHCNGRGIIVHSDPVDRSPSAEESSGGSSNGGNGTSGGSTGSRTPNSRSTRGRTASQTPAPVIPHTPSPAAPKLAQIAAAAHAAALKTSHPDEDGPDGTHAVPTGQPLAESSGQPLAEASEAPASAHHGDDVSAPAEDAFGAQDQPDDVVIEHDLADLDASTALSLDTLADALMGPSGESTGTSGGRPRRRRGRASSPAGPPRPAGE